MKLCEFIWFGNIFLPLSGSLASSLSLSLSLVRELKGLMGIHVKKPVWSPAHTLYSYLLGCNYCIVFLPGVLTGDIFLQNLPSIVAARVLGTYLCIPKLSYISIRLIMSATSYLHHTFVLFFCEK